MYYLDCWHARVGGCEAGCWAWGPAVLLKVTVQNAGNFNGTSLLCYEQYSTMHREIYHVCASSMVFLVWGPIGLWLQERQLGCQFGHWRLLKRLGQGSQAGGADSEVPDCITSSWSAGLAASIYESHAIQFRFAIELNCSGFRNILYVFCCFLMSFYYRISKIVDVALWCPLWPWGLWPWSGLLIGSGLCGPRRDGRFCCTLAFGVLPNLEGQVGQGALCLGFSDDIYDEQFDCEGWKLQVAWHYKTRDTQDSSDVLWNDDRRQMMVVGIWQIPVGPKPVESGLRHQIKVFLGIIHECIWSWEDGNVCELKSAAMIPWISVADENTKEVWKGVVELSNQTNLVYLQTFLTSRLFISCNFLSDQQSVSSLEVKITQLNKKHLIDRFHREAGEHPLQSPMSLCLLQLSIYDGVMI